MLEPPELQDEYIIVCVQDAYGLRAVHVAFFPLGADRNMAVYRVVTADETPYFLKLRAGDFDETSVAFPKCLSDQGLEHIIAPLTTTTGQLWAHLDSYRVILYPFIEGHNRYEVNLSESPECIVCHADIHGGGIMDSVVWMPACPRSVAFGGSYQSDPCRVGSGKTAWWWCRQEGFVSHAIAPCCVRTREQVFEKGVYYGSSCQPTCAEGSERSNTEVGKRGQWREENLT